MTAMEKAIRKFYNGKLQIDRGVLLKLINKGILHIDINGDLSTFTHSRMMMHIDPFFKEEQLSHIQDSDLKNFYIYKRKRDKYIKTVIRLEIKGIGIAQLNMFDYIVFSQPLTMDEFIEVKENIEMMIDINNMINGIMSKSITTASGLSNLVMRESDKNIVLVKLLESNDNLSEDIKLLIKLQTW